MRYSFFFFFLDNFFWEQSWRLFPIAFQMFDDTNGKQQMLARAVGGVRTPTIPPNGAPAAPAVAEDPLLRNFTWTAEERWQLNTYQTRLLAVSVTATLCIVLAMFSLLSQFFTVDTGDEEDEGAAGRKKGVDSDDDSSDCDSEDEVLRPPTYCMKWRRLSLAMACVLVAGVAVEGLLVAHEALVVGDRDARLFHSLFRHAEKEERFLSELEQALNCVSDDDIEGISSWECDNIIDHSAVLDTAFSGPVLLLWAGGQLLLVPLFIALNRPNVRLLPSCGGRRGHHRRRLSGGGGSSSASRRSSSSASAALENGGGKRKKSGGGGGAPRGCLATAGGQGPASAQQGQQQQKTQQSLRRNNELEPMLKRKPSGSGGAAAGST